jgi:hypothetical protein
MICVLDVTAGPARGKRFWIRGEETVAIGRISTADFSVPSDRHMSRQHLILEGRNHGFRLRDVGSANGTYVNNAKVASIELCDGDQIRAGETVFEVSVIDDSENPHIKDADSSRRRSAADGDSTSRCDGEDIPLWRAKDRSRVPSRSHHSSGTARRDAPDSNSAGSSEMPQAADSSSLNCKRSWWKSFCFTPTGRSNFYQQTADVDDGHSVATIVKHLEAEYCLIAVVDTEQVRRVDRRLIEALTEEGSVYWQSPQVCCITNSGSRDFHLLAESLIAQDSLILFGCRSQLSPTAMAELCHLAAAPSRFRKAVCSNNQCEIDLTELFHGEVDFVLFEQDESGRLNLLVDRSAPPEQS